MSLVYVAFSFLLGSLALCLNFTFTVKGLNVLDIFTSHNEYLLASNIALIVLTLAFVIIAYIFFNQMRNIWLSVTNILGSIFVIIVFSFQYYLAQLAIPTLINPEIFYSNTYAWLFVKLFPSAIVIYLIFSGLLMANSLLRLAIVTGVIKKY